MHDRVHELLFALARHHRSLARCVTCGALSAAAVLLFLFPQAVVAQDPSGQSATADPPPIENPKQVPAASPESEVIFEGLASYGHYRIFASGSDYHLYTAGVEYDRNSWGRFIGAQVDYTAEFLPLLLLNSPVTSDIYGSPTSPDRKIVPGVGIYPIGFRMLWRDRKVIKPYLTAKGGMLGFTQKVLSQKATYEDFSLQSGTGLLVRVRDRIDLRLGLFNDVHFSNGFITPVNPGLDVMSSSLGVSYRLGQQPAR